MFRLALKASSVCIVDRSAFTLLWWHFLFLKKARWGLIFQRFSPAGMFTLWSPVSQSFTPDATLTFHTYELISVTGLKTLSFEIQNVKAFLSKRWLTLYKEKIEMFLTITEMSVRVSASWKKDWSEVAVSVCAFVQSRKRRVNVQGEKVHQHINLFCTWH